MATCLALAALAPAPALAQQTVTVWFGPPQHPRRGDDAPSEPLAASAPTSRDADSGCPEPVTVVRVMGGRREQMRLPLLDCDRRPLSRARRELSVLARPKAMVRPPSAEEMRRWREEDRDPHFVAAGVRVLHPALLERLQRLAEAFPGHAVELLSGYRPQAPVSSRHHHGRALDLRLRGVTREDVRNVAATFAQTGVGYYPNSVFVHVDVRAQRAYWVDLSRPGQSPRYVRGAEPPAAGSPDVSIDDALEHLQRGIVVSLPGEEPHAALAASRGSEDTAAPEDASELEHIRRETDALLSRIRIAPP